MNLEFVKMLQKMAAVERDPHFRPRKYIIVDKEDLQVNHGEVPVILKHPDNVVVVASPTGKAPPPGVGEIRVTQLSKAILTAFALSKIGRRGCSIVVHEGLYIDSFNCFGDDGMAALGWPKDFCLEIVGIEEVRVLNTEKSVRKASFLAYGGMQLTIKNLLIYDWGKGAVVTIGCMNASSIALSDVRVSGSPMQTLVCSEGSKANVVDCSFSETPTSFSFQESRGHFQRCRWTGISGPGHIRRDCFVEFEDSFMSEIGTTIVEGGVTYRRCDFVALEKFYDDPSYFGFEVNKGGQLDMMECSMSRYRYPILVQDSHSNAALMRCRLQDCLVAICAHMNGNVSVKTCDLAVCFVAQLRMHVHGTISFQGNSLRLAQNPCALKSDQDLAIVISDRDSKPDRLAHDFKQQHVEYMDFGKYVTSSVGANRRSRHKAKEDMPGPTQAWFELLPHHVWREKSKRCVHCSKGVGEPEIKFRYCSMCRKVCYCSKECQLANWKDHKLVCQQN